MLPCRGVTRCRWRVVEYIPAQISISWLLHQKPWIVPIPGNRSLKRLTDNIEAANITYSHDEMRRIDEAFGKIKIHRDRYNANNQANIGK